MLARWGRWWQTWKSLRRLTSAPDATAADATAVVLVGLGGPTVVRRMMKVLAGPNTSPMRLARLGSFGLVLLLTGVAGAQEPALLAFQEVVPGTTTEVELLKNAAWKSPLASKDQPDGSKLHEFKFGIWPKVTAVVRGGVVRLIDVTPPERSPADKLAEVWELGKLEPVDRRGLPMRVWHGPDVAPAWEAHQPVAAAPVLFFAAKEDTKLYVRQVRFYSDSGPEKLHVSQEGRFAVKIIGEPKEPRPGYVFMPVGKEVRYSVSFAELPKAEKENPEEVFDRSRDSTIMPGKGRLVNERRIRLNGSPGRDMTYEPGPMYLVRRYTFLVGDRLYHVMVTAPKADGLPEESEQFLDSFRLVP